MSLLLASVAVAAQPLARTPEGSKSGPIGLGVILLLCIACYFLFKSMSRHLKSVREDFPKPSVAVSPTTSKPRLPAVDLVKNERPTAQLDSAEDQHPPAS